ncbi:prephenate dehydratase [Ascosphaera pollenicola]|nr:prephenate dehydratase [Ascosphaera pollenicola]
MQLRSKRHGDELKLTERLRAVQAHDQLMHIFTIYLEDHPTDLDMLFEVIGHIATGELKSTLVWSQFIYKNIITTSDHGLQQSILRRCFEVYSTRNCPLCTKTWMLKQLINPMILNDIQKTWGHSSTILDSDIVETMYDMIWLKIPSESPDEPNQLDLANVRMETLQLTATLLKYRHELIHDYRRDIIKYAWAYVRMDDIINKYSGYVLISYFIVFYETPSQLVLQIFTALLKAHHNESISLVLQALDVLGPSLPKRLPLSKPSALPWVRWPRRVLAEETNNSNQVVCVFQFLVKHGDMYYEKREDFSQLIISYLPKLAATAPNPNDTRKVALSLVGLLWSWEKKRHDGLASLTDSSGSKKRTAEEAGLDLEPGPDGHSLGPSSPRTVHEFQIPTDFRLMLIKYLISFICCLTERYPVPSSRYSLATRSSPKPVPGSTLIEQAVQYLRNFLSPGHWTDLDIPLSSKAIDTFLTSDKADSPDEKYVTSMVNSLQVVRIALAYRPNEWILDQLPSIRNLLAKSLRLENSEVQDCLHAIEDGLDISPKLLPPIQRILAALPTKREGEEPDADAVTPEYVTHLEGIASEGLAANRYIHALNILWTLSRCRPESVDSHIGGILKVFGHKLAKDHVQAYAPKPPPGVPQRTPEVPAVGEPEFEQSVDLISKTIDLISVRITSLAEQRRSFLNIIGGIAERSLDQRLCLKILGLAEDWVFNSPESLPTSKEKTAVLLKMLIFEHRPDPVPLKRFLDLIIRIYEDPKIAKTDLAVRLEQAFLIGTRAKDVELRNRFMSLFDKSLSRSPNARLSYVLTSQNWETLKDSFWISQASHLLLRAVDMAAPARLHVEDYTVFPTSFLYGSFDKDPRKADVMVDSHLETLIADHRRFCHELGEVKSRDILEPLIQLQYLDPKSAYNIWITIFAISWSVLSQEERFEMEKGIVTLVTRPYHQAQLDDRPNVIQALIEACVKARPRCKIPPHVMKFLAKTFDVWYPTAIHLESSAISPIIDTPKARESNLDALVELYAGLQEDDLFYGTWRRRCKYVETNAALSHEQNGMWDKAQQLYETAQIKARTGAVPFSQAEYYLWEDHWVLCAEKLQQWDILNDFAKHENLNDLLLESTWRNIESWSNDATRENLEGLVKSVSDAPTPRRLYFQAFLTLLRCHANKDNNFEPLNVVCDDAFQASIRKWHQLPKRITNAHVPVLENFQLLVELHDATIICNSLATTNERNLDSKSAELKLLLGTWRDRLPNVWDDINAWQDLVTWRQHIFQLINSTYLNLLPTSAGNVASNSYAYRGYHEIAWIVNRFAHVARKHQMPEVCINQLSRIYTLPNIEIQEAFLKLREQAKCHYQNPKELTTGLDVINNTNLSYFSSPQKAEFYTLKGMFLAKLNKTSETADAFGVALYFDIRSARAWAEWAQFNDQCFKADPSNMDLARNAMSCYLEAAGLYKSHKSRKILSRILWLLTLDDKEGTISKIFENFGGETPVWYWVTFIPQLLTGLTQKEAELCKAVLGRIAKVFPQSLFFSLRTSREEFLTAKKQHDQKVEKTNRARSQAAAASLANSNHTTTGDSNAKDHAAGRSEAKAGETPGASAPTPTLGAQIGTSVAGSGAASASATPQIPSAASHQHPTDPAKAKPSQPPRPWEYCEEVMAGLKTAFPLLALSMETMVDQIHSRFKCTIDEDAYRLIVALLNDGIACVSRSPALYDRGGKLPAITEGNIKRFMENVLPANIRKAFEHDFDLKNLSMYDYIQKLRRWRDRFEEKLDSRASPQSLEAYSSNLAEFKFFKFDEVEVPGQYLQLKDNNKDFIRTDHYLPDVDLVRGPGGCHRRIKIRGHDGSLHPFAVQHPSPRHCRREERMLQLFRIFNSVLARKKESRRRNINFYLPVIVPLAAHIRLIQDDPSYVSLQAIYEDHCRRVGMNKDDPILFTMEKMRSLIEARQSWTAQQSSILRIEIFSAIQEKWIPHTLVLEYFQRIYPNYADFYLFRRQISYQYACVAFMTYVMHMNSRMPSKLFFSRGTGNIWASDILPSVHTGKGVFFNPEPVPFRLTPNLQTLMGPLFMEGIFSSTMMAIARCLTEPRHELEQQLSIFVRDELLLGVVPTMYLRSNSIENQLREFVQTNTDFVVNRAVSLASSPDGTLPANQSVIDLISRAVNPHQLAQCDALWMAYI